MALVLRRQQVYNFGQIIILLSLHLGMYMYLISLFERIKNNNYQVIVRNTCDNIVPCVLSTTSSELKRGTHWICMSYTLSIVYIDIDMRVQIMFPLYNYTYLPLGYCKYLSTTCVSRLKQPQRCSIKLYQQGYLTIFIYKFPFIM